MRHARNAALTGGSPRGKASEKSRKTTDLSPFTFCGPKGYIT